MDTREFVFSSVGVPHCRYDCNGQTHYVTRHGQDPLVGMGWGGGEELNAKTGRLNKLLTYLA